jgi:hypothetical protein
MVRSLIKLFPIFLRYRLLSILVTSRNMTKNAERSKCAYGFDISGVFGSSSKLLQALSLVACKRSEAICKHSVYTMWVLLKVCFDRCCLS